MLCTGVKIICFSALFATGTFRAEERLRLSDRNSVLMTQINVYIINPVVMGINLSHFTSLMVDFGKVLCSSANGLLAAKLKIMLLLEKTTIQKYWADCFVINSLRLHLTFVAFCPLSVIRKQ